MDTGNKGTWLCKIRYETFSLQETVEVEQENGDGQNMIIILNPNGTINEELMLANGVNQDTIRAVANGGLVNLLDPAANIKNLQHPIPQKDLGDVKPLMTTASIPIVINSGIDTGNPAMIDIGSPSFLLRGIT